MTESIAIANIGILRHIAFFPAVHLMRPVWSRLYTCSYFIVAV